jgi:hypothetical protein
MGGTKETIANEVVQAQQHEVVDVEKEKDADGQQSKEQEGGSHLPSLPLSDLS